MRRSMVRRSRTIVAIVALALAVARCGAGTSWNLSPEGCTHKATLNAIVHVDPSDDRWIWAVDQASGAVLGLRLPGGYGVDAGVQPPALVDPSGARFAATGDLLTSGCYDLVQNAYMIDETDVIHAAD